MEWSCVDTVSIWNVAGDVNGGLGTLDGVIMDNGGGGNTRIFVPLSGLITV